MRSLDLPHSLVYLDTSYIADRYQVVVGESPKTQITKSQGKKAGAVIPLFSAEVNAQEMRTFTVSSLQMLEKMVEAMEQEPQIELSSFDTSMRSRYGWISGELTVFRATSSSQNSSTGEHQAKASNVLYQLVAYPEIDIALITTPEYFSSGVSAFVKLQETLLSEMSIPVRAYIRLMAAKSYMKQWIAIPLVVFESEA